VSLPHLTVWVVVIGVALGFRLWGITWGFPRLDLNPDENLVLRTALKMTWADPNPHFYNYCGFIFHLSFLTSELLRALGFVLDDATRLLTHRLWSVAWGTATVPLVYFIARRIGGSARGALLGAAFMAILPLNVWESHFGTTDAPLLFWMTASLYVSLGFAERPGWRPALVAGLLTGFAAGTKYPGAFGAVPFVAAAGVALYTGRLTGWRAPIRLAAGFGGAAIAGSFLVSPYSYIDARQTIDTFLFELANVEYGHFGFDLNVPGWQYRPYVYEFAAAFPFAFGLPLALLLYASMTWFAWRPAASRIVPLAFVAVFFGITGSWRFVPVRYFMPLFPIGIIAVGLFLDALIQRRRSAGWSLAAGVAAYTILFTATTTHRFRDDTRLASARWAENALPPGSIVLLAHARLRSYSPLPDPERLPTRAVSLRELERTAAAYKRQFAEEGTAATRRVYIATSGLEFLRYYRSGVPESIETWDEIRKNPEKYRPLQAFEAWFLNVRFYAALDPMFASYFVSPRIEYYEYMSR
jgi:hypothetical protein